MLKARTKNLLNDKNIVNAYSITGNYSYKGYFGTTYYSSYTADVNYRTVHCTLSAGTYTFYIDSTDEFKILRYSVGSTITSISSVQNYYTITTTETAEVQFCFRKNDSTEITDIDCMIVEGSTAPSSYIPYVSTIHELYKNNSGTAEYIGEMYKSDGNGGYEHIFSAGWDTTVTGTSPLTLPNARAKNISNYNIDGQSEQKIEGFDYTDYTPVEYCRNNTATKVQTGIIPTVEECEYYCRFYAGGTGSLYLFTSRGGSTQGTTQYGISGSSTNGTITSVLSGTITTSGITRTVGHIYTVKATCTSAGAVTLYVKDETDGTEDTKTKTVSSWTAAESQIDLFGNEYEDYLNPSYRIYEAYFKEAGVEKLHYYPATDSSSNVGFFDTVTQTFKTASNGSLVAGDTLPVPTTPIEVESCGDKTINLFDNSLLLNASDWTLNSDGYYTGQASPLYTYLSGHPITGFKENTVYTIKGTGYSGATTVNFRFKLNYSDGTNSTIYFNDLTATTKSYTSDTSKSLTSITSDYGSTGQLYLKEIMIVEGSTVPSTYEPYNKYKIPIVVASNVGMVDLGSLTWTYNSIYGFITSGIQSLIKAPTAQASIVNAYCERGTITSWNNLFSGGTSSGYMACYTDGRVGVASTLTDATAFKAAMSGVYLFYQRSTDDTWTTPTITNIYLDEPLRKVRYL